MDAKELLELIQKGESSLVQFKLRVNDAYKVGTEIVAFANTKGGTIIIGIDDKTGQVKGLSFEEIQHTNQLLANAATDNIKPSLYIFTETIDVEGQKVVVAEVPQGTSKPHIDNKGIIWIKNGSDKRKVVVKEEMARLLQNSGNLYADEMVVEQTSIEDIDLELFASFVKQKTRRTIEELHLAPEELLTNMAMMKEGRLTLGGLLLLGENPQKYKPMMTVHCVSFVGNNITSVQFRDKADPFVGNLKILFEKTMSFIYRNLKHVQAGIGFNSQAVLELPQETIEELVINALIHRDHFSGTNIKVFIFDDRVEILSPGVLPNTLTIENIKFGASVPRNPTLFSNARYILPFVGVGTGIPRAFEKYPDLELTNDTYRGLFIATIKRQVQE